jgi:hypothetical protein
MPKLSTKFKVAVIALGLAWIWHLIFQQPGLQIFQSAVCALMTGFLGASLATSGAANAPGGAEKTEPKPDQPQKDAKNTKDQVEG